jgi:NAD(P)-dependent dehydrogenase (short-subunit alcohol dehydrogenase family)
MVMPNSRVTVITGGGSGMGRATALRLARNGDPVYNLRF